MRKQKGFTFWSLTFTVAVISVVALLTMKLLPAYTEYFAIKRAIHRLETEGSLPAMDNYQIKKAFNRSQAIEDFHSVKDEDLKIRQTSGGDKVVSVDYEVIIPIVANASILLKFDASTGNASSVE